MNLSGISMTKLDKLDNLYQTNKEEIIGKIKDGGNNGLTWEALLGSSFASYSVKSISQNLDFAFPYLDRI